MIIHAADNTRRKRDFLDVHVQLNRFNPDWIQPLDKDIEGVFDPKTNKAFRNGEAIRWVAYDGGGHLLGRIAAYIHKRYRNKGDQFPVGGIGFFDCINDQNTANQLFDTAKNWLVGKGVQGMDGPINFGERDKWWGLLVEGFHPPLYGMPYNPPYYQQLFEVYGFEVFYNQICWYLPVASENAQLQPKFYQTHDRFLDKPEFKAVKLDKRQLDKFARDFCTVYNKAWASHAGNKEMSEEQARKLFRSMKPILDETLMWFTYHNEEPIAIWLNIPDLNQAFRHLHGKFGWWQKLKFMYLMWRGVCDRFVGLVFGIVPEFQGKGVDYFMIVEAEKVIKKKGQYKSVELMWQGDFNPKMLNISQNLGGIHSRRLITYRYIFDRSIPFQRHPILN
ncbi:MAG: hypothetical protein MUE95_15575 [Cyclobacteriaceae bacterium]|nr:hypothetical protein [Cyclobacteriaceae bacterium]